MNYDHIKNIYEAYGNVSLDQEEKHLEADSVKLYLDTKKAKLKGNVFLKIGNDWIKAEAAEIDLTTYQSILFKAEAFMSENHIYVQGEQIQKTGERTYFMRNAQITTCDAEPPPWHFSASRIKVTLEGRASAYDVTFWAKSIPLAYAPYLTLPVKTKRQSGFLFPSMGHSSRDGFDITLPFFWAIKPNMDITFYPRYLSDRGYMQGIEYRYILNEDNKGSFHFDYLNDSRTDIDFPNDDFLRSNRSRWWWRSKQDHILPGDIYVQLDVDLVSDQDYFKEFGGGFNNFYRSQEEFLHYFTRGFDSDDTTLFRESSFSLTKDWSYYSLIAETEYTQNLDTDHNEFTLQRLPQLSFLRYDSPLFNTPLFLKMDSNYTYFWRSEGQKGQRLHFAPSVSLPYRNKYFKLLPRFSFFETSYFLTNQDDRSRFLYETSLEAKTDLWGSFSFFGHFIHHLEPSLIYTFRSRANQSKQPNFDQLDQLPELNQLTYKLTNYFFAEKQGKLKGLMRFFIEQSYNFSEKHKPLSDLLFEWQMTPLSGVYLDADTSLSAYGDGITEANIALGFSTKRGDLFIIDYHYHPKKTEDERPDPLEEIEYFGYWRPEETHDLTTQLQLNLINKWSLNWYNVHSLAYGKNIERRLSLIYNSQCWGIGFSYSDSWDDERFMIIFSLTGIGEIKGFSF